MMRSANLHIWSLSLLVTLACASGSVVADGPPSTGSLLTIDRLFGAREFETESVPLIFWSQRSSTYFTLDKAKDLKGRDLVRIDPATGKTEIIVPAAAFLPKDAKEPLKVEAFEFSADESRLAVQGKTTFAKSPGKDTKEIVLRVNLQRGTTQMQAWFQDAEGTDLAGAFYAYVRPVSARK